MASYVQPGEVVPFGALASFSEGLICLTGGKKGALFRLAATHQRAQAYRFLEHLNNVFPGNLYLELQLNEPDDSSICLVLAALAHKARIPTLATHSVYYLEPGQADLQRTLTAIRLNQTLHDLPVESLAPRTCQLFTNG